MRFSVITVCWNSDAVLPRALASLRAQTYRDFEWVVVDGGSTDGTLDIVRAYADGPLTWISEKDSGIYNAMNKGVGLARGDCIFFLNSDDALHDPDVLADVAARLDTDASIDLLYGNVVYEGAHDRTLRTFAHIDLRSLPFEDLCHQAVFARRSLFERVGLFNERFRLNADYDWLIRVFRSGATCVWFDRIIAKFRVGGEHMQDLARLAEERKQVRLQYMSQPILLAGELVRRIRHRLHRHFGPHPLGNIPLDS